MTTKTQSTASPRPRLRPVAIPAEHGGWSFLLEPILLALIVAPSAAGVFYGVGMFFAFMTRHPLKLALSDRRRGKRLARTPLAERFALFYGGVSAAAFALAVLNSGLTPLLPLLLGVPLFVLQAYLDATNRSRSIIVEFLGPVALALIAVSIGLAGGWTPVMAFGLWFLIVLRAVPSIAYVRARLRLERGADIPRALVTAIHLIALALGVWLVSAGLAPALSLIALTLYAARAAYGLSDFRKPAAPKIIGIQEVVFGVIFVALSAIGYRM